MPSQPLPARPSLVYYRKQAKALVKQVRAGDESALRRVEASHPHLGARSARARPVTQSAPFTLADAQLVVARELGARSWAELKRRLHAGASSGEAGQPTPAAIAPNDAAVQHLFASQPRDVAFVVGLIGHRGHRGPRIASRQSEVPPRAPSGDTAFAASTMPFTGLVFADLVRRRRLDWTDPLSKHLPSTVRVPTCLEGEITLLDLMVGRSGLAMLPPDYVPADPRRPFSDFTVARLNECLDHVEIARANGRTPVWSLVALWLLQLALAHRGGASFDQLLRALVLDPLGMGGTRCEWVDSLAGAAGLRTTANDLLSLLQAFVAPSDSALRDTLAFLLQVKNAGGLEHPIGWACTSIDHAFAPQRHAITWTEGWTPGSLTFFGFSRRDQTAAVVAAFSDSAGFGAGRLIVAQNLGLHLLDDRWPMTE